MKNFIHMFQSSRIGVDEEVNDAEGKTAEEIEEMLKEKEAKANAQILELVKIFCLFCCSRQQKFLSEAKARKKRRTDIWLPFVNSSKETDNFVFIQVGDIPDVEAAPPENVLFVCKLNPVTTAEDLEIIFSRFGKINRSVTWRSHRIHMYVQK